MVKVFMQVNIYVSLKKSSPNELQAAPGCQFYCQSRESLLSVNNKG